MFQTKVCDYATRKLCPECQGCLAAVAKAILGKGLSVALAAPLHPAGLLALGRQLKHPGVSSRQTNGPFDHPANSRILDTEAMIGLRMSAHQTCSLAYVPPITMMEIICAFSRIATMRPAVDITIFCMTNDARDN